MIEEVNKVSIANETLGYVMFGYEKSIASLMFLDYKSETIQTLVSLIYLLQCSDDGSIDYANTKLKAFFAKKQTAQMMLEKDKYLNMFDVNEYEYLLRAISYFGNN